MKEQDYMKAVLEKLNPDMSITCEDCGNQDKVGHFIVDHQANTVKAVCHSCFVKKYQAGLYGKEYMA
jgi:transcription elongation factor Elf1